MCMMIVVRVALALGIGAVSRFNAESVYMIFCVHVGSCVSCA